MNKYRASGAQHMPIAFVFGVPPAFEIMANFSGLHMDMWGEMEMVGTIMDRDIDMVPCETIDLTVPANAEIVVEGRVNLKDTFRVGDVTSPSMYHLPHYENLRSNHRRHARRPADYRNHQTTPDTDAVLPRLSEGDCSTASPRSSSFATFASRPGARRCPASSSSTIRASDSS